MSLIPITLGTLNAPALGRGQGTLNGARKESCANGPSEDSDVTGSVTGHREPQH